MDTTKMRKKARVLWVLMGFLASPVWGTTYYVDGVLGKDHWNGQSAIYRGVTWGPKATIQGGIDAARDGDEVIVAAGVYSGVGNREIDFQGKGVRLRSESGAEVTVVDCEGEGRGFSFHNGEDADAVLDGFTIMNGQAIRGGGIYCRASSPVIMNCVLYGNSAWSCGGAIYCEGGEGSKSTPEIYRNEITGNTSGGPGGGISIYYQNVYPTILYNLIAGNRSEGWGGGVSVFTAEGDTWLINNTIVSNESNAGGGGVSVEATSGALVRNSILWDNRAEVGADIEVRHFGGMYASEVEIDHSDIRLEGVEGESDCVIEWSETNISADPLFEAAGYWDDGGTPADENDDAWLDGDYRLRADSPCVKMGNNMWMFEAEREIEWNFRIFDEKVDAGVYESGLEFLDLTLAMVWTVTKDSVMIKGSLGEKRPDLEGVEGITLRVGPAGGTDIFEETIRFDAARMYVLGQGESSYLYYVGAIGGISYMTVDLARGVFFVIGQGIPASALVGPLQFEMILGDYYGVGVGG